VSGAFELPSQRSPASQGELAVSIPLLDPAVVDRVARQRARRRTAARVVVLTLAAVALLPRLVLAQGASPWENAVDVLRAAFTGPIARGLSLVAIVVGGLAFAYGEGQSKRMIAGIVFGVGMAIGAVNFMAWLFP
jgi:type IV secretory pathway VirB2 component (pilin)